MNYASYSDFKGAFQIVQQIIRVFQPDTQPDRALGDAACDQRVVCHAKVRCAGGVDHQTAAIAHIGQMTEDFEGFDKGFALLAAAFEVKAEDRAGAAWQ